MNECKRTEEFRINGGEVWTNIKKFVHAGNIRHIIFINKKGQRVLSMTVTIAVILAILAPQFVIAFTLIVLAFHYSIIEEREEVRVRSTE